jgi:aspartokinase-like uncharacterized kinase
VKVGGSLYDRPDLGPGLRAFVERLDAPKVLIVAGGGVVANAVRDLDSWQGLGDETAHTLAMISLWVPMQALAAIAKIPRSSTTDGLEWWRQLPPRLFLKPFGFLIEYEQKFGPVPHTWDLTSDSIAVYAAAVGKARLILLKSVDVPAGTPWEEAAARGWVDRHFPDVVAAHGLRVEVINFRRWLDERGPKP